MTTLSFHLSDGRVLVVNSDGNLASSPASHPMFDMLATLDGFVRDTAVAGEFWKGGVPLLNRTFAHYAAAPSDVTGMRLAVTMRGANGPAPKRTAARVVLVSRR